jgi:hypothetical protein
LQHVQAEQHLPQRRWSGGDRDTGEIARREMNPKHGGPSLVMPVRHDIPMPVGRSQNVVDR